MRGGSSSWMANPKTQPCARCAALPRAVLTWRVLDRALLPQQRKHCPHVHQGLLGLAVHCAQEIEGHRQLQQQGKEGGQSAHTLCLKQENEARNIYIQLGWRQLAAGRRAGPTWNSRPLTITRSPTVSSPAVTPCRCGMGGDNRMVWVQQVQRAGALWKRKVLPGKQTGAGTGQAAMQRLPPPAPTHPPACPAAWRHSELPRR